jgi:hypothetical protein
VTELAGGKGSTPVMRAAGGAERAEIEAVSHPPLSNTRPRAFNRPQKGAAPEERRSPRPQADRSAGTSYWVLIIDRPTSGLDSEIRLHLSARPAVDVTSGQGLGERDGSALGYRATYPQLSHSMNAPAVSLAATRRT